MPIERGASPPRLQVAIPATTDFGCSGKTASKALHQHKQPADAVNGFEKVLEAGQEREALLALYVRIKLQAQTHFAIDEQPAQASIGLHRAAEPGESMAQNALADLGAAGRIVAPELHASRTLVWSRGAPRKRRGGIRPRRSLSKR